MAAIEPTEIGQSPVAYVVLPGAAPDMVPPSAVTTRPMSADEISNLTGAVSTPVELRTVTGVDLPRIDAPATAVITNNVDLPVVSAVVTKPVATAPTPQAAAEVSDTTGKNANTPVNRSPFGTNPLHNYASYTYLISLHLMDTNGYNKWTEDTGRTDLKTEVLIASGGVRTDEKGESPRHKLWNEDFFFEDLKIFTVVGNSATNRGTSSITIDFKITEPNGTTLIERMIETAVQAGYKTFSEMIYGLRIEFVGYDDAGNPTKLPSQTKFLPINILSVGFKISNRGSEYAVFAIPVDYLALQASTLAVPVTMSITAGTVAEYFSARGTPVTATDKSASTDAKTTEEPTSATTTPQTSSLCDAINEHERAKVANGFQAVADSFQIVFDDAIGKDNPLYTSTAKVPINNVPMSNVNYGVTTHQINAGTNLIDEINRVVRNSKFLISQLGDPIIPDSSGTTPTTSSSAETLLKAYNTEQNKKLVWWRIVPHVKIGEFDPKRGIYGKDITYHVVPYDVYSVVYPLTPCSTPPTYRKYDYIFSGKNADVLEFDINYDSTFYVAYSTNAFNMAATTMAAQAGEADNTKKEYIWSSTSPSAICQRPMRPVANQSSAAAGADARSYSKEIRASDIQSLIMARPGGDMLQADLVIVGDPSFIKQPSMMPETTGAVGTARYDPMQSDSTETYLEVAFKTPSDFNAETGLYGNTEATRTRQSVFSGFYRILNIESTFERGAFKQKIAAIRIYGDDVYNSLPAVTEGSQAAIAKPSDKIASDNNKSTSATVPDTTAPITVAATPVASVTLVPNSTDDKLAEVVSTAVPTPVAYGTTLP